MNREWEIRRFENKSELFCNNPCTDVDDCMCRTIAYTKKRDGISAQCGAYKEIVLVEPERTVFDAENPLELPTRPAKRA